jgi:hypothetical protein
MYFRCEENAYFFPQRKVTHKSTGHVVTPYCGSSLLSVLNFGSLFCWILNCTLMFPQRGFFSMRFNNQNFVFSSCFTTSQRVEWRRRYSKAVLFSLRISLKIQFLNLQAWKYKSNYETNVNTQGHRYIIIEITVITIKIIIILCLFIDVLRLC